MKKTTKNTTLTPEQYIRQKARTLPLGQCYMNKNWFISGMAIAVVCRCHKMGTYTFGVFQFDTFCTGLIECKVEFSRDQESYNNFLTYLKNEFKIEPVTYQEAHNLIYGAIAFGEDAGFTPSPMFNLAKYILEEDTEDIPLINYQFGRFGKHFLLADNEQELDEFMPHLIAHLGKENVLFGIAGSDRYFKGEDFYDSETRKVMRQIVSKIRDQKQMPVETYSYVHPAYPTTLNLKHQLVGDLLYDPANRLNLSDEQLDQLLALPHDELREDLHQVLQYEMGRACDEIPATNVEAIHSALIHGLLLLGELGDTQSLPVVLETMCQKKEFYDYEFGVLINEIYVPTLYNLGKNQLDTFFEFLQIPGLYTYIRYLIFPTVVKIAEREPERRAEVIEWFRKVLVFYTDHLAETHCCDGMLVGLMATDLIKLKAVELLPELKVLYQTGKVNEQCSGNFENVEQLMKQDTPYSIQYHFELKERYEYLRTDFNQFVDSHNKLIDELMKAKAETASDTETTVKEDTTVQTASNEENAPAEEPKKAVKKSTKKTTAKSEVEPTAKKTAAKTTKKTVKAEKTDKTVKAEKTDKTVKADKTKKAPAESKPKKTRATKATKVKAE